METPRMQKISQLFLSLNPLMAVLILPFLLSLLVSFFGANLGQSILQWLKSKLTYSTQ